MNEPNITDILAEPLSELTRIERRNLLIGSVFGFLVAYMDLVPTRLSVLGIDFSSPEQNSFLALVAVVIVYFLFAFIVYGLADFFVWREKYQRHLEAIEIASINWTQEDQFNYDELHQSIPKAEWLYNWRNPLAFTRLVFEFFVPLLAGVFAISQLLIKLVA